MGTLYIVSTPIGNLGDVTVRALDVLRGVVLVAAEDTRRTRKLLSYYEIHCRLTSLNEHSSPGRVREVVEAAREGNVAVLTDAGTPGISDPGRDAVLAAIEAGVEVTALPGPSAVLSAVVLSGMEADGFCFLGFLPRAARDRAARLAEVRAISVPLVFFEAPHRLARTLEALERELGDRPCAVARELTKLHEEVRRSTLSAELAFYREHEPRGEFTLVVAGAAGGAAEERDADALLPEVARLVSGGARPSEAIRRVARERGASRSRLYQEWQQRQKVTEP